MKDLLKYKTGCYLNQEDNRDIDYSRIAGTIQTPAYHITDISMIPVLNQPYGTCVAHAIATTKMYQEHKEHGKLKNLSRRYLYSLARKLSPYTDEGLYPRDGAKALFDNGILEPDTIDNGTTSHAQYESYKPTLDEVSKAKINGVKGYAFIPFNNLSALKQAIVKEGVVTASLGFNAQKWVTTDGFIQKPEPVESYHYIALYGYEDKDGDTIFYFRNSWSEQWGNKGNGSFKWSDYQNYVYDVIAFTDIPKEVIEEARNTQYIFKNTLRFGMRSPEVVKLQERLREEGFFKHSTNTGYFGGVTMNAVIAYQRANKLFPDGIVGAKTREVLNQPKKKL